MAKGKTENCILKYAKTAKSERLQKYLNENCAKIIEARDCMIAAREKYDRVILPISENESLIAGIDHFSDEGFTKYDDDRKPLNNATPTNVIKNIKDFFHSVDPSRVIYHIWIWQQI